MSSFVAISSDRSYGSGVNRCPAIVDLAHNLHALPVWSGVYTTDAAQRITGKGGTEAIDAFRRRLTDPDDPAGKPARR